MNKIFLILLSITFICTTSRKITNRKFFNDKLLQLKEQSFGFPTGKNYYIAQKFQDPSMHGGKHLGIDISGYGKGNSDLGDTIYSIGHGLINYVALDRDRYLSIYYKHNKKFIKVIYYHCDTIFVNPGLYVNKGEPIATIGNDNGIYLAHLHLEVIKDTSIWFGGYGNPKGFINPELILPKYKK